MYILKRKCKDCSQEFEAETYIRLAIIIAEHYNQIHLYTSETSTDIIRAAIALVEVSSDEITSI